MPITCIITRWAIQFLKINLAMVEKITIIGD